MPILGLILVGLIASGLSDVLPRFLRFLLVFAVYSYLPGVALIRWAIPARWRAAEVRLPLAAISGISFFLVVSWLCWILGLSFSSHVAVLQGAAACVFAFSLWISHRHGNDRKARPAERGGGVHKAAAVALLLVACAVSVDFFISPPAIDPRGDSLDHLGYIRNITVENTMEPEDVLAPAVFASQGPLRSDPRKGALHPFIAAISTQARLEPVDAWRWLPVVLAPLAFLGFAAFASALLPSGGMVVAALAIFLMFQGGIARQFLGAIAYGQHLSLFFYWILFVLSIGYASAQTPGVLGVIALVCLGGSLGHVDVAIHTGLMYTSVLLFYRKFNFSLRPVLRLGLALAVGMTIAIAWKVSTSGVSPNLVHAHPQGLLYFGDIGDRFFVASPVEVVRKNGLVFLTGLLLVPFLPLIGRGNPQGRYASCAWMNLALALPPIAVAFNPFVAPLVFRSGAYLLHRFVLNVPAIVIAVLVIGSLVAWGIRGGLWKKAAAVILLFAAARPFVMAANAWRGDAGAVPFRRADDSLRNDPRAGLSDVIRLINEELPEGSVVVSDPVTSYILSGFSRARVVAVLHQHGNPNDPYPIERLAAVHAVMSPYTTQTKMMYAIRKFGADYVVVNGAFTSPYHDFLADWDPGVKPVLDEKIGGFGEVFKRIYKTDRLTVYQVLGTDFRRSTWDPLIPFTAPTGGDLDPCELEDSPGRVRVAFMGLDPHTVLPGERVKVTAVYRRGAGARPKLPLSLHLRFEDRAYFENAARYPGDKYVRRFLERRDGEFRRFRIDRTPFAGFFRPEEWPEDHSCYDEFDMQLPVHIGETAYEVRWRLVEQTLLPNFSIRDFLYNDDSEVGSPCTGIDVRGQVAR